MERREGGLELPAAFADHSLLLAELAEVEERANARLETYSPATEIGWEGCLSVPGIYADVSRAERVRVRARDRHGEAFEETLDGMHAVCLQHEMDHLEGKLFIDYLSPLKRRMVTKKLQKQRKQATTL